MFLNPVAGFLAVKKINWFSIICFLLTWRHLAWWQCPYLNTLLVIFVMPMVQHLGDKQTNQRYSRHLQEGVVIGTLCAYATSIRLGVIKPLNP